MSSCLEAREALSKLEGFIRVHPFGHNGKVLVYVANPKAIDEEKIVTALRTTSKGLKLRKIARA